MAKLTNDQQQAVAQWAADGANLNEIQDRLKREYSVTLTYLDARLLITELGVKLQEKKKDAEVAKAPAPVAPGGEEPVEAALEVLPADPAGKGGKGGKVNVQIDQIAVPGAIVSGRVSFSDGKSAVWYLDQHSRLGLKGAEPGYQPPPADIPVFQDELDRALQKAGY